ncbi:UDP-N-acetylmuramate dehydrogenase [Blochmannia endosymbiont of Camponotus modoc]|uniref:UDP-N-acetylmuramate dehydrogenase n=1 Tax=Blochmannia endosymbiont of Camponotus modoc TaxID=2945587 RepID=UPI002024260E|nr:UDP-N-acetylmuramate dehydrogenase [Blochmannia endosymbiont of Camponotus modoc]URJ29257.1 UDP-N-acetylmuramate dehydrogenase [Blochmannia endosymbiont of Camponotus modoc]
MERRFQLKSLNTFSVNAFSKSIVTAHHEHTLLKFWRQAHSKGKPVLILGGGSNILFLEDYSGTILLNRIKGIFITENKTEWQLHVGAGEKWDELVVCTIKKNIPGLENLACIPGYVGAAPIQNIGAYGVELSQICEYVDAIDLCSGKKIRFTCSECDFKYRDSIFRNCLEKYAIVSVGLRLRKRWKPILDYHELAHLDKFRITPRQVFNFICIIRHKKLPDPVLIGNAGSFFKNPIIDIKTARCLFQIYPNMSYFYQKDGRIKLSAGWLIEHCQLKGYVFGEAAIYPKQALVLINRKKIATGTEIAALALYIYNKVADKFNIYLQPEVRLIGNYGEINPKKLFM